MKERILGLDVGDKYIGVAVSDLLGITAQGVSTLRRQKLDEDLDQIKKIVEEYQVKQIVIGLPKNMDGSIGIQGNKAINCEIIFWDERLTTKIAQNILIEGNVRREKRKAFIDKIAAQSILQNYMDSL